MDQGESLLAVTGLRRVLSGDPPKPEDVAKSLDLQKDLKAAVSAYLRGERAAPARLDDLDPPEALPTETNLGTLQPDAATGYGMAAERARAHLKAVVPERRRPGLTEKKASTPFVDVARRRRAWQAVEAPLAVLRDLDRLSVDHLATIKAVYPGLFSMLGVAAGEASAEHGKPLTARQERALSRLIGGAGPDVAALQRLHQTPQAEPKRGPAPPPTELATPMQRTASQ